MPDVPHQYTPDMLADRLAEMRAILLDHKSKVGEMTAEQQAAAAAHIEAAIQDIASALK